MPEQLTPAARRLAPGAAEGDCAATPQAGPSRAASGAAPSSARPSRALVVDRVPRRQRRGRAATVVGVLGELLITASVLVLVFAGWQVWWTDVESDAVQSATVQTLTRQWEEGPRPAKTPDLGDAYAILIIPRFGANYARPALEGTDHDILAQGLGHYQGTAQPGEVGNASFAGHRTTYGKPLWDIDTLQAGDAIIVRTAQGYFRYRMVRHEIVPPSDIDVIEPVAGEPGAEPSEAWLTLTSCNPKYSARERYIVHAKLEATASTLEGLETAATPQSER